MPSGRQLLLGLDVGTTATKAVLFDLQGEAVASASQPYPLTTPQAGWVEQNPEDLWTAVVTTIRAVLPQVRPTDEVIALSQASQGGTTIPVDAGGRPVTRAISWMDGRGVNEAKRVEDLMGRETVRITTGWPLNATLPLQHVAWLSGNCPAAFERTHQFLFVNDFITVRLTNHNVMDPSNATMTQLFNIATGDWDDMLLEIAGIERDRLSPIQVSGVPVGQLTPDAAATLGLPTTVVVVNGAHDQYCAAVGTGTIEEGKMLLSAGTAWVLLAIPHDLTSGLNSGMAISCHAVPGRWGAIRSLGGVGASLEWLISLIYDSHNSQDRSLVYTAVNSGAANARPGAGGLLFFPLAGGHAPDLSGHGGFVDLTLSHARADLARAVMEGIAFELRWAIEEVRAHGVAIDGLTMVGGAAKSPIWSQIVADVAKLPVSLPAERQAAARGAAILAGVGAGVFADVGAGLAAFHSDETRLEPDCGLAAVYDEQFARYRSFHSALRSTRP